jgi:hypothetical protein
VVGPSVFSFAIGTPKRSQTPLNWFIKFVQLFVPAPARITFKTN